ncbi:MAG: agmatine deiminase family protein [Pirellulaceae bacterium]
MAVTCPTVLAGMVRELQTYVEVVVLVSDKAEHHDAMRLFADFQVPMHRVRFAEVDYDTMWIRDYGPQLLEHADGPLAIDSAYDDARTFDERVPTELAKLLNVPASSMPLRIAGEICW